MHALLPDLLGPPNAAQRRALAKAITLIESSRAEHRLQAHALLDALLPHTGRSLRLGISGVPGVGKSTFIEALGLYLIGQGQRVAVLAVDPSSSVSGGSILGDKTRMERLSSDERAYIRPSPSRGQLGGVAEKTREAILLCEAAGYGVVIVETVGVGQSETAVHGMTDLFCLLQLPNAGDELQAIKKGVMELADLVLINKADLDPAAATRARAQIVAALRLFGWHGEPAPAPEADASDASATHATASAQRAPAWQPQVLEFSALSAARAQPTGAAAQAPPTPPSAHRFDAFWAAVTEFRRVQQANGQWQARRQRQASAWMWALIEAGLKQRFAAHPQVRVRLPALAQQVQAGQLAPSSAAHQLLALLEPAPPPQAPAPPAAACPP
ncbi:MAG: methylmalonyl Co-A mutase-associated GTPase MeaB [Pseudomonadota bacterium]|jgi:LAO/AO transport system kinase